MISQTKRAPAGELPAITVDWELAFVNPIAREAADYWLRLRGNRDMPARSELSPASMRSFLKFVNLVTRDMERDGSYVVRLQGQHARDVFGHLANQSLAAVLSPQEEERWRFCFDLVHDSGSPVRLAARVATQGKLWLDCEVFIAPLSEGPSKPCSLFWVFVSWTRD